MLIGGVVEGMAWLGTFHSIAARILRRHAELVGLKPDFTILDADDQLRLIKQLLSAENIDDKRWPARQLASMIDGWKNRGLTPERLSAGEAQSFANGRGGKLYAAYQERLKILNAADFGDLLLLNLKLFQENADVLKEYQQRFRYMLVDEYQDTNVAQYLWLRLLAQGPSQHLLRRRRRPVDLWLARRRGRQHFALREGFSRRQSDPPRTQLPLHPPHPRRRLRPHRPQRGPPRQDAHHREAGGRADHPARPLGRRRGSACHRRRHRVPATKGRTARTRWPSWCAPRSRCAPSRTASSPLGCPTVSSAARAFTSAPRSAMRSPISRSPSRPTMTLRLSASSTSPSAASAIPR